MLFSRWSLCFAFYPCVCMDVYAGNYRKKHIFFSADTHAVQMVIIQDAVVYPFAGCAVFIYFFIFPRTPGNGWVKARVPAGFCIDAPPVWGFGAFIPARAGVHFMTGQPAAPFAPAAAGRPVCSRLKKASRLSGVRLSTQTVMPVKPWSSIRISEHRICGWLIAGRPKRRVVWL